MSKNELRQLALDLRRQNPSSKRYTPKLPSRLQIGSFTKLGRGSSVVSLTNQRKRSLTATFPWCTLRVVGSFLIQEKLVLEKQKEEEGYGSA